MLCRAFRCRMDERACLQRQQVRTRIGTVPTAMAQCSGCEQGREVRTRLEQTGRLEEVLERLEKAKTWHARRSAQAMKARRRSPESAAPAARATPSSPAPPPAAAVVHPKKQKEKPMPAELKCVTPGCQRNAVFRKTGQCKVCYQRAWSAKKNGPGKKCACGETIRRDNKIGMCKACKKGDPTPGGAPALVFYLADAATSEPTP